MAQGDSHFGLMFDVHRTVRLATYVTVTPQLRPYELLLITVVHDTKWKNKLRPQL